MKRFWVICIVIFAFSCFFIACGKKTEVAWKNGTSANINDIAWASDNIVWEKGQTGYDTDEQTDAKEVKTLTSDVECAILEGGTFQTATVEIGNTGGKTVNLTEGSSEVYTINASVAK